MSKLVGWSCEQKSAEVRREAAAAIQALFALNPAQVVFFLSTRNLLSLSFPQRWMICQSLFKTVLQKSFGSNLLSANRHFLLVHLPHCQIRKYRATSHMNERVAMEHLVQIITVGLQSVITRQREPRHVPHPRLHLSRMRSEISVSKSRWWISQERWMTTAT